MKITHQTQDKLMLDHVPWVLSIGLSLLILLFVGIGLIALGFSDDPMIYVFAFMFIVVGGGLWFMALGLFAKRLQFIFDRQSDQITLRRRSIFGHEEVRHNLSRLVEVRLEHSTAEGGTATYRPVLILRAERSGKPAEQKIPMHHYFTSERGPERICETVNRWLSETRGSTIPRVSRA